MDCFCDENINTNSNKVLSDNSLIEKKNNNIKDQREQCCFCLLFSGAIVGTSIVSVTSHGATLASDIPDIIVSASSALLCFRKYIKINKEINEIDAELDSRKIKNIKYVDNFSNLSIYNSNQDTLKKVYQPII